MKISGQRSYHVSLESVVMTDIILNMFIFFFISFSLLYTFSPVRMKNLEVNLPEAKSASQMSDRQQIFVTINNEGVIYLDKDVVTRKALKDKISLKYRENPALAVVVSSDRLVRFKDVVAVLDILNAVGVKNLNIAAVGEK